MVPIVKPGSGQSAPGGPVCASLPILAAGPGAVWVGRHSEAVRAQVAVFGAVLLRGVGVRSALEVADVASALGIRPMTEREGFAPRTPHAEGTYSSSHWPAYEAMCMHHELSYAAEVPGYVVFGCLTAPAEGGRTNVADSQQVLRALPADLVAPFARDGWLLTRMYNEVGLSWMDAFGTRDPAEVDAYCATAGIEREWLPDGRLCTRQRRAALIPHPRTGILGWFNQIAFLNELALDAVSRNYLLNVYGPSGLPFNTTYGDGSPISSDTIDLINEIYGQASVGEPWHPGDVLVVDNLRMAHGREPYKGAREIVVLLGDPVRLSNHILPLRAPRN
jgi:Taurine catabolism dioxygenase TauD, TfdA family